MAKSTYRKTPIAYLTMAVDPIRKEAVRLLADKEGRSLNNYMEHHMWPLIWPIIEAKVEAIDPDFFKHRLIRTEKPAPAAPKGPHKPST